MSDGWRREPTYQSPSPAPCTTAWTHVVETAACLRKKTVVACARGRAKRAIRKMRVKITRLATAEEARTIIFSYKTMHARARARARVCDIDASTCEVKLWMVAHAWGGRATVGMNKFIRVK